MQTFFAYHFLQSLAFALLNSLWQMAFLWVVYNITTTLFSTKSLTHFKLLVTIQVTGFAWFAYTFFDKFINYNSFYYENYFSISNSFIQEKMLPVAAVIYMFFAFVFIAKFFIQLHSLNDVRNEKLLPISNKWQEFVNATANKVGIKKNVQIKISKSIATPLTIGFLKPIILIPIAAINQLTVQQLEAILLHELAHIKRNDYVINLLLLFVDAVMFFNPFSKYIGCLINKQRELSCDDAVLEQEYSNSLYAEALLNVAKFQLQTQHLFGTMTAVNENEKELKYRIKRILKIETENREKIFFNKQMAFSFLFGSLLFILIGFINVNVKKVITDSIPTIENNFAKTQPIALSYKSNDIYVEKLAAPKKVKHLAISKKKIAKVSESNDALKANREIIKQGFTMIGKLATDNDLSEPKNVVATNKDEIIVDSLNTNNIVVTPAINNHPTTTVQRFFVPATSKSAASMIVITTTEKEDGKKVTKIEIEKGNSKVE